MMSEAPVEVGDRFENGIGGVCTVVSVSPSDETFQIQWQDGSTGWRDFDGPELDYLWNPIGVESSDDFDNIIQRADFIVDGDRQEDYGHPSEDFSRTAKMWSGLLNDKLKDGERIDPSDVPLMMILLKASRLMNKRTEDEATDIAGYIKTFEMTLDELQGGFDD